MFFGTPSSSVIQISPRVLSFICIFSPVVLTVVSVATVAGHVGVYVGNGMEVDARGDEYGVCYEAIGGYNNSYFAPFSSVSASIF